MSEIIKTVTSSFILIISFYIFSLIIYGKNKRNNIVKEIFLILIASILNIIIYKFTEGTVKTLLICLLYALILKYGFKLSITKSIFTSIIFIALSVIPELLILGTSTKILNVAKDYIYLSLSGSILGNIIVSIITILIAFVFRKQFRKLVDYDLSNSKKIILVSALTLILLAIFFYNLISSFKVTNNIFGYLAVIIALIIILFYLFKQRIDNEIILKKYDDLLNIMKNYESDIEEQRTLIHETRNELMTIKCKINDKEKESAIIRYIDSILGDKVSSNMSKYSKFKYLPSNGLKGFFYYKFNEAEQRGIKVSVNISKQIEKSFLSRIDTKEFKDLVRMIGVYLDNAIDASATSKDKKLGIEVYLIKKDIEIIISNTYNDTNIDMVGKEKYTTKGKNHGYGLLLVKGILKSNKMFEATTTVNDNLYVQKLKIKSSAI